MVIHEAGLRLIAAGALLLFTQSAVAVDGDVERGRTLAYSCMGCHGIENYKNAYPKYSVPKLGGQNTAYIQAALEEYQAGARWHPTMKGYAASLSAQDRADLAAWFTSTAPIKSGGKPVGAPPPAAAACGACHGSDGIGTLDEYPNLAGQHADYLAQALNDYRLGTRKNPIMSTFAQTLTREDIQALAAYFAKQSGLQTPKL
ncbi:MAG: c-type cytochrome [Steroidobacteraceae bacterium]